MKVFISGSSSVTVLSKEMTLKLDALIKISAEVLVGDCIGVDTLVQQYMKSAGYTNVKVYHVGAIPRNNLGFTNIQIPSKSRVYGRAWYQLKDIAMTNDADAGVVFWDGRSKGSLDNIYRLKQQNKPVEVIRKEVI